MISAAAPKGPRPIFLGCGTFSVNKSGLYIVRQL